MQDSLYVMRSEIGNQYSALRSGLVCSCREDLRINLADVFWIFNRLTLPITCTDRLTLPITCCSRLTLPITCTNRLTLHITCTNRLTLPITYTSQVIAIYNLHE